MPLCVTSNGLILAPEHQNWLLAAVLPLALAIGCVVPWSSLPTSLFIFDHIVALQIILPAIVPFVRLNFETSETVAADVAALRATSGAVLIGAIVHLLAHVLGRTVLVILAICSCCVQLQAKCWGVTVAASLQGRAALSYLPVEAQSVLRGSLLNLLDRWSSRDGSALSLVRAMVPLLLLGPDSRDDALRLLPPEVLHPLPRPTGRAGGARGRV